MASGNQQWDYLRETHQTLDGGASRPIPTRRGTYCYYSDWQLIKINPVNRARQYAVYIYDACDADRQIIPRNANQCVNDSGHHNSALPSTCVTIEPGHLPIGLPPGACNASAEASVALHAALSPTTYDPTHDTALTATTSFATDFRQRLAEANCTDLIDWHTIGWTLLWPDGHADQLPATGQQGTTATHTVAGNPRALGPATSDVTAIAHLHIHGTALDFDGNGNIVTVTRDAFVDISNKASANGSGLAPAYTPPTLAPGAIAITQSGDGSIAALGPAAGAATHLDAVYGRLLRVYPRVIVVTPGSESIGGVAIGSTTTVTTAWTYAGGWTDAPAAEATAPGTTGTAAEYAQVQYNHAERLDNAGRRVDEVVPLTISAMTTYPDGTTTTSQLRAAIPVTIYYVGLANPT